MIRDQLQNYEQKDQRIIKKSNYFHGCKGNIKPRKYAQSKYSLSSWVHFRLQMNQISQSTDNFQAAQCCFVLVLTVCRSLGSTVGEITGKITAKWDRQRSWRYHRRASNHSSAAIVPQPHSYGLTQRRSGARTHLELSHEEITLASACFLFLSDWINADEPADDNKGIALQNNTTSYKHAHKTARSPPLPGIHADESPLPGLYPSLLVEEAPSALLHFTDLLDFRNQKRKIHDQNLVKWTYHPS